MSLGLGVFLSTLVVSTILLYHWGYLGKVFRVVVVVLGGAVLIAAIWVGYLFYESRPTVQTTYQDLTLGMSMEEVIYTKGQPNVVFSGEDEGGWETVIPLDELEKQKTRRNLTDYSEWSYDDAGGSRIDVRFSPKTKRLGKISCYAAEDYPGQCSVLNVTTGTSEESLIEALGKPEHENIDGVTKTLHYPELNLVVRLTKRKAYMFSVQSPADE